MKESNENPSWLDTEQLAKHLKVKKKTIHKWCTNGRIPFYKCLDSRKLLFDRNEIDKMIVLTRNESVSELENPC